jgi:hypothetical protein
VTSAATSSTPLREGNACGTSMPLEKSEPSKRVRADREIQQAMERAVGCPV